VSVGLKSLPEDVRLSVARKREQNATMGLGYWGARDAIKKAASNKK
jgi:hypothetical protein